MAKKTNLVSNGKQINSKTTQQESKKMENETNGAADQGKTEDSKATKVLTLESVVTIWQPTWAVAVYYAALVIVLLWRPTGLFGQKAVRAQ